MNLENLLLNEQADAKQESKLLKVCSWCDKEKDVDRAMLGRDLPEGVRVTHSFCEKHGSEIWQEVEEERARKRAEEEAK